MRTLGCFFVSDLHGLVDRYQKLFAAVVEQRPWLVFMGGDLLPTHVQFDGDFARDYLVAEVTALRDRLGGDFPEVCLILGNDDGRAVEEVFIDADRGGLWHYAHGRRVDLDRFAVYGYGYVPPTPFLLKDWERYDVSRYVDPGSVSPEDGHRTVAVSPDEMRYATIRQDLEDLSGDADLDAAIFLFHSPPYETALDRAALDGQMVDHAPLDVHVGSVAIRRFIEDRQPLLTLHGHIHESARLTGSWRERLGRTHAFNAAHDGPELALVRFDLADLDNATRELL